MANLNPSATVSYVHSKANFDYTSLTDSGSCQFPTLGFVVDRYHKVRNFIPEQFWTIKIIQDREEIQVSFSWQRQRLFDRAAVVIIFERCINARVARVIKVQKKPTSKWKPLPLTTVELQKLGSRFLRLDSKRVMEVSQVHHARFATNRFIGCGEIVHQRLDQLPPDGD